MSSSSAYVADRPVLARLHAGVLVYDVQNSLHKHTDRYCDVHSSQLLGVKVAQDVAAHALLTLPTPFTFDRPDGRRRSHTRQRTLKRRSGYPRRELHRSCPPVRPVTSARGQ
jgi:hypothetical protein